MHTCDNPCTVKQSQGSDQRGYVLWVVLLGVTSLGLIGGAIAFFILDENQSGSEIKKTVVARSSGTVSTPTPENDSHENESHENQVDSPVRNEEGTLSETESERVLEFYMERLETAGKEPEGDLINEVLNLGFAVANEVQNIALDTIEMPEGWDEDYGDTLHTEMLKKWDLAKDPAGQRRLDRIVRRLERFVPKGTPKFKVHLLKGKDFNAFAVAGGHLYVTTGMLTFVKGDDELAAVLGHEMAHVYKGHCQRKMKILTLANSNLGELGAMGANIGLFMSAPFGKSDELEADANGRAICTKAGFERSGMINFLQRMARAETNEENYLEKMLDTHPYTRERVEYLRQR